MHTIITWVGFIFVKAETVRIGNEQVLENFKEGVIMIEPSTKSVLFANESAKNFDIRLGDSFGMRLEEERQNENGDEKKL